MAVGEIYIKLAVAYGDDPKVRALARYGSDAGLARDLYVQMICYCKRLLTDGFVPDEQIGLLVYPLDPEHGKQLAKQLASVGLTKEEAGGWQVLAYLKRNGSRADVERLSEVRAEAGRRGGEISRKPARQNPGQAKSKQVASGALKQNEARDRDRDRDIKVPTTSGADEAAPNVGVVVAAFVDEAQASGQPRPPSRLCARVGKDARALVADGYNIADLIESAKRMGAGEWSDLAMQVRKDAADRVGARAPRRSTTDDRVAMARQAAIAVQARLDTQVAS